MTRFYVWKDDTETKAFKLIMEKTPSLSARVSPKKIKLYCSILKFHM